MWLFGLDSTINGVKVKSITKHGVTLIDNSFFTLKEIEDLIEQQPFVT